MQKRFPSRQVIRSVLHRARALGLSSSARLRLTWFLFAAEHDWNVSLTCRHFGIARSTFVRWKRRFDPNNPESLEEHSRRPNSVRECREDPVVVAFIQQCRISDPHAGKQDIADRLQSVCNLRVSPATVGRIIQRHGFFFGDTPSHRMKRKSVEENRRIDHRGPSEFGESADFLPVFGS